MRWKLLHKFLVPSLITILLGMGSVTYIAFYLSEIALRNAMQQQLVQLSEGLAAQVDAWLTDLQLKVEQNSQRDDFVNVLRYPDDERVLARANTILRSIKDRFDYVHVAVVGKDGITRASSNDGVVGIKDYGDRGYFQTSMTGQNAISEVLKSRVTGNPVIVIASPVYNQQTILGITFITVDLAQFTQRFIDPVKVGKEGFAYIVAPDGTFLAYPEKERILKESIMDFPFGDALLSQQTGFFKYLSDTRSTIAHLVPVEKTGWVIVCAAAVDDIFAPVFTIRDQMLKVAGLTLLVVIIIIWIVVRTVVRPIVKSVEFATAIAEGNLEMQLMVESSDEIGTLAQALQAMKSKIGEVLEEMNALIAAIQSGNLQHQGTTTHYTGVWNDLIERMNHLINAFMKPITMTATALRQISKGDIPAEITEHYKGDFEEMKANLNVMITTLRDFAMSVRTATDQVAIGSQELSQSAEQISQGASKQAATAEEVSSTMEQITANIRQNADNAMQTEKIAVKSAEDAEESGKAVLQTLEAIRKIAKKIQMIEDIAQKTHMLSLNATIEASKAQEHGKGFAVVASEVRSLAERSRLAAEEINELATSSVTLAEGTHERLSSLIPNIQHTAQLVQEISAATHEQKAGSEQINLAVQQLDQVIQQNASISEENAATAVQLSQQAGQLRSMTSFFTITEPVRNETDAEEWEELLELAQSAPPGAQRKKLLKALSTMLVSESKESQPAESAQAVKEKQPKEPKQNLLVLDEQQEEAETEANDELDNEFEHF